MAARPIWSGTATVDLKCQLCSMRTARGQAFRASRRRCVPGGEKAASGVVALASDSDRHRAVGCRRLEDRQVVLGPRGMTANPGALGVSRSQIWRSVDEDEVDAPARQAVPTVRRQGPGVRARGWGPCSEGILAWRPGRRGGCPRARARRLRERSQPVHQVGWVLSDVDERRGAPQRA